MSVESLPGIRAADIETARCRTHALFSGPDDGVPVVFVHGNLTTSRFMAPVMAALPDRYHGIALDLRGFGGTEPCPIDATRGMGDWADDLAAFIDALGLRGPIDFVGWSLGGGVLFQYAIDHPDRIRSLTLSAPISPYGFGGTRDAAGTPTYPDFAASGAATAAPEYVQRLRDGDRTSDSNLSPRPLMKSLLLVTNVLLSPFFL
jgi:pimeloyl-ACP methyl ester carboxylesterase